MWPWPSWNWTTDNVQPDPGALEVASNLQEPIASAWDTLSSSWLGAFSDDRVADKSEAPPDMLDPRQDAFFESFHKACVTTLGSVGPRNLVELVCPSNTVCHYDVEVNPGVRGFVALTIDDAPCRHRSSSKCMARAVQGLLAEYDAKATFFLCSDHVPGHENELVRLLLEGHEIANHCPRDRSYYFDTEEDFDSALMNAEGVCQDLRSEAAAKAKPRPHAESCSACCGRCQTPLVGRPTAADCASCSPKATDAPVEPPPPPKKWFRAPQGSLSAAMGAVLERRGFAHVLCDAYANDPWISDPEFIAGTLLDLVQDGSIIVVHMPERGFREYTFEAIRLTLAGLAERQLRSVTLSVLRAAAERGQRR